MPKPRPTENLNYHMWRKYVLERDGYICRICGSPANHAHHLLSYKDNPELRYIVSNGSSRCLACHKNEHSKEKNGRRKNVEKKCF